MSEWKPPADAVPSKNSGWKPPPDAIPAEPSFQSSLRPAEYPLTSGAAGGGSMPSATGSAGSVATPAPSPEPQGPPSSPAPDPQQERTRKRSEALQAWSNLLDVERQAREKHAQAMAKEVAYSDLGMRGKVGTQSDELRQAGNAIITTEAAKKKLGATFDSMLDEIAREEVDRNPSRFIKKGDLGQDEINAFAVRDAVDAIAKQYGLTTLNTYRDQGGLAVTSQSNEDIASLLQKKITDVAQANIYLPKVKAIVEPKVNELTGKVWDKFTTDEVEMAKAKQLILSERSSIERSRDQEAELLNEQVAQKSATIKAEWELYQAQVAQRAQQVNDLFQSGQINEQQANEQLASLNADQEARLAHVNGKLDQELALVNKNIASINRKYNGQLSARQDQIIAAAEANIKKSAEEYMQKFPNTPEGKAMALEARRIEKEAWNEVIKKDAQMREVLAKVDEGLSLGPGNIPGLLRQAYKSTVTSLGGSLKGWASALNSADLYALGEVMERSYLRAAPPSKEELENTSWTDKLKKSLQPVEFAKNSGELLGGMAVSLAAGAAAGAATSGIGVAPALAASGTAAWGAETMDMAGRARDAMLKKTGDNEKADKAFWDTVDSQVDLSWTYALGGLPFVKGSLKFIPTKAGRVAAGALAEYGEEVLQEVPQNIAERNIAEGRDPWEGFLDELRASMESGELSNTLVKMLPVAGMGAGGQIMESGESTEKQAAKIAASLGTKSEIGRLISGSANEWAGRLAATNGERTAKAVISSMYTSGAIDDKQMLALNQAIEKYLKARKEAFDLGVPSMYRGAYADLMMQHDDLMQQIEAEGSDIAKSALKARASEVKKAAIAIADGLPDYIQVKHPDGSINTLSVWDAERLFHDKRFLQATALAGMGVGGIQVSYMGVDAKALDALASFQERAAQELLRIKAEATSRRNSAVSPPVSVEAPNVADDRKAIMAKTKEALRKMVADFQSQRATGQLGGSAVIESKEALNTQPKDEVDAILDEEFAEEPEADVSGGLAEIPAPAPEAATVVETPQGTGVEVEVGPTGAVTPEAISAITAPTAPEAVAPEAPVAQKPKGGKKAVAQAAPAAPTAEPVTSITEVKKSKDGSQVEYKVPGWEDLRIVVQREKGGYAANIMVGDQALKIQPKGKEEGTAKLAILDAKERLDRAGREKISALISSATPSAQRPQSGIGSSDTAATPDRIENVIKALRSIVPDLAVIVHDTPEEFAEQSRVAGGRGIASDAAFYDPKTNAIHLNRQMASDNTLFHEAAHPILLAVLQNNPELFLSLYEQLAKDPAFDKYIKFGESYSDKDELTRAAESLAEFMADVAAGKVQFSKEPGSLWQKFVEWLQELMAKVGLDFRAIDLSNPQNVRDFASKFARGVREGIELKGLAEVRRSDALPMMQRPKAVPVEKWNAMVPTIREALKSGATPEQVMEQIGDLAKGLDQSQKGAIQGKIQQVYDKIETMRKKDQIVDKRISEDDSKKLADAEKLRKSIKKGLKKGAQKRRDVYLNELAKDFTSLRIPKTALDDYINMATAIKDLIRGASVAVSEQSVDALRTDAGVTNEQIEQYIQQQQQAQQALDEQEMLEEFEQKRIEMGLEGASLTLDDIRSLMNSFAAEEQQQEALEAKMKAEQKLQMLRTMSRLKLEELSEHLKSQELDKDKKRVVANLKLIDIDRLSAKDAVFLIGMVNNIVKNDRWGGARTFSEEVGSSERAIALMQEFAAMRKKLPKPKAARNATEQVVMMMRRFFGEYSDKIAEALGMDGILNASAQANRMAEEIHKARDKYAKSVGYKDTELNRYRAQAYAYLQSVEGDTQEQQQASFEKLRNDLLESARMLMDPTRDTHRVKFPDLYIQAVAEVAEPARSLGDVKVAEPIRKMVEWEQQQHAKDYAMHAQAAELDHNKRMGYVRAYTARGYFETDRFTETQQNRDPSVLERFFDGTTVKERLAGSKMDRVGRRPSQIVDLDFFSVQDSARRELYMDTFGARYIARMRGVLTDPRLFEGDNPVMTRATRDIMTQRVRSLIKADQVVADVFSDKWTKAYNKVSRRASAIALVGTGAFIKQLTPLVSTFFHVRPSELVQGMRDAMETHREGTWQNNIAKTQTIYERAQVMAGLERIGETVARKAVLRGDENRAMELSKLLYTEAGHLSKEYGRRTIAFGDAWAATATWWAFYRQYIRKAGLENTNWKAELNEQAAAYASDREQFMQGANIPEANAPMYRNMKLPMRVVLDIFFSFNSFNLNNLNRMSHDIKDIRFGSPEARKRGYIDLAARLFEMAAFRATTDALRIYATLFLADLILEAIGDDPEDDRARRADADAKKYDYWVRLLADVGMDFVFTGMGDIPTNVVKDGFNTIVNLAERDTGPKKRNYDLYYVSDKDSYGVLGILYGQASNLFKAAEVMSMYKGVEGKEAKRMRDEAMILAALSVAHLAGYTDQTITRGLEREIVRRLPYQVMHKREERFGQVLGKALYDLIDQDEPYTPSDTYYDLIDQDEPYTPSDTYEND